MPAPTYDLDPKEGPQYLFKILGATFALVAAGAGIIVQRIGMWFGP